MKNVDEQEKILRAEGAVRRSILTVPMGDVTFVYCEWDIVEGPFVGLPLYTYGYKFDYNGKTYGDFIELSHSISLEMLVTAFKLFSEQMKRLKAKIDMEGDELKEFRCGNGHIYHLPKNHCAFCDHCIDVFWDYTNGPYMFICELECDGYETCGKFEEEKCEEGE